MRPLLAGMIFVSALSILLTSSGDLTMSGGSNWKLLCRNEVRTSGVFSRAFLQTSAETAFEAA
jgi:hypothetical protein